MRTVWTRFMLGDGLQGRGERNMEFCIDQGEHLVVAFRDIDRGEEVVVDSLQDRMFYDDTFCDDLFENIPLDLSKNLFTTSHDSSVSNSATQGDQLSESPLSISLDSTDSGVSGCEEEIIDIDNIEIRDMRCFKQNKDVKYEDKKRKLPCTFCPKYFDRPSLLTRHIRTHTGERPHSCNYCCKSCSTSSSLNTHVRIEKSHTNAMFARKDSLLQAIFIITK